MKRWVLKFLVLLLLIPAPELCAKDWVPPKVLKVTLSNGFRCYLLPDHTLPLFRAKLFVETGGVYDPASKSGLADITAMLLATGGTKSKTPNEVDQWLAQRAISLESNAGRELTTVTLSSLTAQKMEALDFLKEALLEPRFDDDRFLLAKKQYQENLRRSADLPDTIVSRNFRELVYGGDQPWGRSATPKTIKKIQKKDVVEFYQKYFHPNQMLLAVAGDFSPQQLTSWVKKNFGDLSKVEVAKSVWEDLPLQRQSEEKKIKRKLTQAFIEVGDLSLRRDQEEKYAYGLLQYILGGEVFTSRLGADIRATLGLAYSVYSTWETNPARGFFKIHVETRKEALDTVLERIRVHLKRVSEEADITQAELDRAKEALLNQYIFWFDSPFNSVEMEAKMDLLGYEKDYLKKYPQKVNAVTLEQVKKVAKEYIHPDSLKIVIVGP